MVDFRSYREFSSHGIVGVALGRVIENVKREELQPADLLPGFVFIAFAIEAYINWVGSQHIEIWDEIERLSWRRKIVILYWATGRDVDWGSRQLQFVSQIFKLRDRLAHGKPEIAYGPVRPTEQEAIEDTRGPGAPQPSWHGQITVEQLLEAYTRYREFVAYLGALYGRPPVDLGILATTGVEEFVEKPDA